VAVWAVAAAVDAPAEQLTVRAAALVEIAGCAARGLDPQKAIEDLNKTVPLGHIAEPEEIADVMVFLASDEARYIAGETVEVTGAKPVGS
jgi:NAD(P)-dependent dehydrogenase (short-subunit alcohol dehydrogenase family)